MRQFEWKPVAGGNQKLIKILQQLKQLDNIEQENAVVVEAMKNSAPYLIDVVPAYTVIPEINGKVLLHAGPPIQYDEMTGPMQGSCIGAALLKNGLKMRKQHVKCLKKEK